MSDPRPKIISSIDCAKCHVEYDTENPIVLLFGGAVAEEPVSAGVPKPPVKSMRDAIIRKLPHFELYHPEKIGDWLHDGVYKDLVQFESDLSAICSLVVVVSESPGSIAELAYFANHPIAQKMLIFATEEHAETPSFINYGIFRLMERLSTRLPAVKAYPWRDRSPSSITENILEDVIADIDEELKRLPKRHLFRLKDETHLITAIYRITSLFAAVKLGELEEYLSTLGFEFSRAELSAKLFLMEKFRLIEKRKYSGVDFYIKGKNSYHHMSLSGMAGAKPLDDLRIMMDCREYYRSAGSNERHRVGLLKTLPDVSGGNV